MPDDRRYDNNYYWVLGGLLNDGWSGGMRNLDVDPSHLGLRVPKDRNIPVRTTTVFGQFWKCGRQRRVRILVDRRVVTARFVDLAVCETER
jgi:hypothetical protein